MAMERVGLGNLGSGPYITAMYTRRAMHGSGHMVVSGAPGWLLAWNLKITGIKVGPSCDIVNLWIVLRKDTYVEALKICTTLLSPLLFCSNLSEQ